MEENNKPVSSYGKRSLWQWVVIYAIGAGIVYGLVYYFILAKKGGTANPYTATPQTGSSPAIQQTENTVTLSSSGYSPSTMTVKAGTTVTWMDKSGQEATVNSDPHPIHTDYPPLNLGKFPDGGSLSLTFDKAGTYGYHNHLDPGQKGTIVVQ